MNQPTNPAASATSSTETSTSSRLSSSSSLATSSSPSPLARGEVTTGQVTASQPLPQGGHRVEVTLANGQQLSLTSAKAFPVGQELQVTGKTPQQVELRPMNLPSLQQSLANQLASLPNYRLQVANPSLPSLPPNSASLALVTGSQQLSNNQGYLISLQLAPNKSLQVISSQPLNLGSQVYLASNAQGELTAKPLPSQLTGLANLLRHNLPLVNLTSPLTTGSSPSATGNPAPASLSSLLASASEQLRYALPRQAPMQTSLSNLTNLLNQLTSLAGRPQAASTTSANLTANPANSSTNTTSASPSNSATSSSNLAATNNANLATSANQAAASLPRILSLVQQLLGSFPMGNNPPTGSSLQAFIQNSGMFFEASLSNANQVTGDLKLRLHQLGQLIRQDLASNPASGRQEVMQQLSQQLQAISSRLEVQQLSSLQAIQASAERGQPAQQIQMDLPYAIRGEWFEAKLEIKRWLEEKETEEALEDYLRRTKIWEVKLNFTLEGYGKLHTHLRLQDTQLSADVWVEETAALSPIKSQAELLAARLRRLGADIEEVNCYPGSPPSTASQPAAKAQIINTKI